MLCIKFLILLSVSIPYAFAFLNPAKARVAASSRTSSHPTAAFMVKIQNETDTDAKIKTQIEELLNENLLEKSKPEHDMSKNLKENEQIMMKEPIQKETTTETKVVTEDYDADDALRMLSSEVGVKRFIGEEYDSRTPPFDVIFDRTLDTLEDAMVHARRIPHDLGWVPEEKPGVDNRPTVVVLGSGWAAHAYMKIADTFKVRVVVVSPTNHFVFTPMLASAAVGTVEYRSMTEAVRAANPMLDEYIEGKATDIDVEKKTLTIKLNDFLEGIAKGEPPTIEISYDTLIVSVGTKVNDKIVPGAKEYGLRLKSCDDARKLRTAVGESFEYASRPDVKSKKEERRRRITFMIVGGGPTVRLIQR